MRMTATTTRLPVSRRGFTLIELLVVISIIAVLVALTAGAAMSILGSTPKKTTRSTIERLQVALKQQWSAVLDTAKDDQIPSAIIQMADGDQNRARVIWTKFLLKKEFPQTFAEAIDPGSTLAASPTQVAANQFLPQGNSALRPNAAYFLALQQAGYTNGSRPFPSFEVQNATLLILALQQSRRGGVKFDPETALGNEALKDSNGDGLMEATDGWEKPIIMVRWGLGHPRMRALGDTDKQDPDLTLANANWNPSSQGAQAFQQYVHPINVNGQVVSLYSEPTVLSYGEDGAVGASIFLEIQNQGQEQDNIYSFDMR